MKKMSSLLLVLCCVVLLPGCPTGVGPSNEECVQVFIDAGWPGAETEGFQATCAVIEASDAPGIACPVNGHPGCCFGALDVSDCAGGNAFFQ